MDRLGEGAFGYVYKVSIFIHLYVFKEKSAKIFYYCCNEFVCVIFTQCSVTRVRINKNVHYVLCFRGIFLFS